MRSASETPARRSRTPMVVSALTLVAYFVWMANVPPGGLLATAAGGVIATTTALVAGVACWRAGRRSTRTDRAGWSLLGAGMISWSAANVVWLSYVARGIFPVPFPSVIDAGFLLMVPLCVAGVFALARLGHRGIRVLLDGLIISGSLLVVSWILILGPAFAAGGQNVVGQAVSLAYPIGDVAIGSMVFIAVAHSERRNRAALGLVGSGMLGLAIADSGFVVLSEFAQWNTSAFANVGWIVGFMLVAHGARRGGGTSIAGDDHLSPGWLALPYVPLAVAIGSSGVLMLTRGSVEPFVAVLDLLLVLFVVVRQVVALRDNVSLTERLQLLVRELQDREEQLRFLAFHDPLTGLPNRSLFQDRLAQAFLVRLRVPAPLTVIYVDLDGFKEVNDTLGHEAGDSVLMEVATRLRNCLRAGDTVARLGGDEFAVLLDAVPFPAVIHIAERIVAEVGAGLAVKGEPVRIGASVGVAYHETGDGDAGDLLRRADLAMYAAKYQGKSRYVLFEPHMREGVGAEPGR